MTKRPFDPQDFTMFYLGAILPDMLSKPPTIVFSQMWVYWLTMPTHSPVAGLLLIYIVVMFFHQGKRLKFYKLLFCGSALHMALDVMQKHIANGGYFWLFPFSWQTFNVPLFWPSDSILAIPFLLFAIVLMEYQLRIKTKSQPIIPTIK